VATKVKQPPEGRRATARISTKNQVTLPVAALGAARLTPRAVITIEAKGGGRIVVRAVGDEVDKFEGQLPFVWLPNSPSSQSLTPPIGTFPATRGGRMTAGGRRSSARGTAGHDLRHPRPSAGRHHISPECAPAGRYSDIGKVVPMYDADWEQRASGAWASLDQRSEVEFLARIENLASELPADSGVGSFLRAASLDSTDHPDLAVPMHRQSQDLGLTSNHRRRPVIQLATSLRNLGQPAESVALLAAELAEQLAKPRLVVERAEEVWA
jgi:hypothetical protein